MIQFLQTLELYFNAFFGVIAGVAAVILIILAVREWRAKNEVAGALFVALAALCLLIGITSIITDIQLLVALKNAAETVTENADVAIP
jgi:uncharacterized membrane protein YcjF (UPF0283 family)